MNKKDIIEIFEILKNKYKIQSLIELKYKNPYTLLVAVILSAQATDAGVNKATKDLFEFVDTPEKMLKLGEENLKKYIKSINYYNTKAKHIIQMSQQLIEKFNSQVPSDFDDMLTLSGVGRKTANVVLNILFDEPRVGVDTHVFRVVNRLNMVKADNVLETEKQLLKKVPQKYLRYVNHYFVLFGRYECKAIKPKCESCELRKYCGYYKDN
ncbi:MAG: endonuclease III [Rickettsiales bacterium]|nr:endonuclease III [Rickettsiales bacterium]